MDEATLRRLHLIEYLQGTHTDDGAIVIGAALVVEIMQGGERMCFLMSSDAAGQPLAWHTQEGYISFASQAGEFDWDPEEDE